MHSCMSCIAIIMLLFSLPEFVIADNIVEIRVFQKRTHDRESGIEIARFLSFKPHRNEPNEWEGLSYEKVLEKTEKLKKENGANKKMNWNKWEDMKNDENVELKKHPDTEEEIVYVEKESTSAVDHHDRRNTSAASKCYKFVKRIGDRFAPKFMQNARQVKHTAEEVVSSFNMQCDMSVVNQRKVDLTSGVETVELLRDIFCRYREINARLQYLEEGKRSHEKWLSMKLITINPDVKTELDALNSLWNGQMKKSLEDTINSLVNSKYKGEVENIQRYGVQDLSSIMRLLIDVYSNASEVGPEDLNVMETKMKNLIILAVIQHAVDGVANLKLGELKKVLRILEGFVFALIHFHDSCKINLEYEFDLIIVPMVNILQKIIEIVNKALGKVKILPETAEIEPLEISLSAIKSFLNGYTK